MKSTLTLESKIRGSFSSRFSLELFRNSGYFGIVNILLESLVEWPVNYLKEPHLYAIICAVLFQAFFLTKWSFSKNKNKFLGNLIGPTIYTCIEFLIEGISFFQAPHHIAYWFFSILIGFLQHLSFNKKFVVVKTTVIILENTLRSLIVFVMYMALEWHIKGNITNWINFIVSDRTHIYLLFSTLLLGIGIGTAEVVGEKYLFLLKKTSNELKSYSEWLFGKNLLEKIIAEPTLLNLRKVNRVVLFMDIRGFTQWSESNEPEEVVSILNQYFSISESILESYDLLKVKFTGDEVLAIYIEAGSALRAAIKVREKVSELLNPIGISVGIGINEGRLMEGIVGAKNIKYYDVIGDTVNTGKRIEGNADSNEILISSTVYNSIRVEEFCFGEKREIVVKGKVSSLMVYPVLSKSL